MTLSSSWYTGLNYIGLPTKIYYSEAAKPSQTQSSITVYIHIYSIYSIEEKGGVDNIS